MVGFVTLFCLYFNLHSVVAQTITLGVDGAVTAELGANENGLLRIVAPVYPVRAQQRGVTGWNLVNFSVDVDGNVDVDSISIVDSEPSGIFDQASILAAAEFKFRPAIIDGVTARVDSLQYVLIYTLETPRPAFPYSNPRNRDYLPLNYITPEYPLAAREEEIEGHVLVEFTVTTQGRPRGIVILDRSPSDIFNVSAVNAAERFRFEPRIMNGEPVEAEGAQYQFVFELDD